MNRTLKTTRICFKIFTYLSALRNRLNLKRSVVCYFIFVSKMNGYRRIFRFRNIIAAGVGVAAVTAGVATFAQCSAAPAPSSWNPALPGNIPDTGFGSWNHNWDLRDPRTFFKRPSSDGESGAEKKKVRKKPSAVRHLILIRHGQYNLEGATDAERVLTPLGVQQAQAAGKRLKELGIPFDSLISSNMSRAIQTAQIIKENMEQKDLEITCEDPLLREGAPALPEPPVSHWHPDLHYYEDGARIESAFRKYFHRADPCQEKDSYELVVCHANVIRYFACRALQFPGEAWLRISLCHTSLNVISILPSGRVILRTLGDGGHLPVDQVTTS
ncbi:unnamed protein product [Allacma fusca]|uniref:Serine/threonine-protein phosphatase PGAM5, mitochondrial n=1 Tax=Allacma fusca TaxID=39272 RepID=A0A8J2PNS9_9HEXA|nr:unnamed protein product [Allacma fusca]